MLIQCLSIYGHHILLLVLSSCPFVLLLFVFFFFKVFSVVLTCILRASYLTQLLTYHFNVGSCIVSVDSVGKTSTAACLALPPFLTYYSLISSFLLLSSINSGSVYEGVKLRALPVSPQLEIHNL